MRFAICSYEGTGLSWWKRLQDEGHEVLVYIFKPLHARNGDGIIPKTNNYAQWVMWGKMKRPTVFFFDCSDNGDKADALRKSGELVVGGCKFFDRLEKERAWSEELHRSIGIKAPFSQSFPTISAAKAFASTQKKPFVFKSNKFLDSSATYMAKDAEDMVRYLDYIQHRYGDNISNLMQEKLDGFALSTARWWNGRSFVGPFEGTVEHKKFLNDDKGPATGCSFTTVWFYQDDMPSLARALHWDKLEDIFRKYEAAPGLYDINSLLSERDGLPYFLESTPRLGYDSEPTSQKGIANLGQFLYNLATGQEVDDLFDRYAYFDSVRVTVSPYPFEAVDDIPQKKTCVDTPIWGYDGIWANHFIGYGVKYDPVMGLTVADPTGLVGIVAATGLDPTLPFEECYNFIDKELRIPNMQYRTDAADSVEKDLKTIKSLRYEVR